METESGESHTYMRACVRSSYTIRRDEEERRERERREDRSSHESTHGEPFETSDRRSSYFGP